MRGVLLALIKCGDLYSKIGKKEVPVHSAFPFGLNKILKTA